MRFRKLRIAWSVGCGIACVLLIVLWVRSNSRVDGVTGGGHQLFACTARGQFYFGRVTPIMDSPIPWEFYHLSDQELRRSEQAFTRAAQRIALKTGGNIRVTQMPLWLPTLVCGMLAVVPWPRQFDWRFSLRTLLIATALVAVLLGLITWMSQTG